MYWLLNSLQPFNHVQWCQRLSPHILHLCLSHPQSFSKNIVCVISSSSYQTAAMSMCPLPLVLRHIDTWLPPCDGVEISHCTYNVTVGEIAWDNGAPYSQNASKSEDIYFTWHKKWVNVIILPSSSRNKFIHLYFRQGVVFLHIKNWNYCWNPCLHPFLTVLAHLRVPSSILNVNWPWSTIWGQGASSSMAGIDGSSSLTFM